MLLYVVLAVEVLGGIFLFYFLQGVLATYPEPQQPNRIVANSAAAACAVALALPAAFLLTCIFLVRIYCEVVDWLLAPKPKAT
jgi:hypothetical protein